MAITIGQKIKSQATDNNGKLYPNIDDKYGPYSSTEEALTAIPKNSRAMGLTVGIIANGIITEYWFQGGVESANLIAKVPSTTDTPPVILPFAGIPTVGTIYNDLLVAYTERINNRMVILAVKNWWNASFTYEEALGHVQHFGLRLPTASELYNKIAPNKIQSGIVYNTNLYYWSSDETEIVVDGVPTIKQTVVSMGNGAPYTSFKTDKNYIYGVKELVFDLATGALLTGTLHDTSTTPSPYTTSDGNTWINTKSGVSLTSIQGTWVEF